jgi:pilus assembly protein CpaD
MTVSRRPGPAIVALACLGLVGGLSACATQAPPATALPTTAFKPELKEVPDQIALGVHAEGLSVRQRDALKGFAARWKDAGGGALVIKLPVDAANPTDARAMAYAVRSELEVDGVPPSELALTRYTAGAPNGPVLASFQRAAAVGPDCSGGWDDLARTMNNAVYAHFGCADAANTAAMLADPRDLVAPPDLSAGDNTRRGVVLGHYRDGKKTASEKEPQADGAVSAVTQ